MSYENASHENHWPLANLILLPRSRQQRRLVSYLLRNQRAVTVDVNRSCAIGNISDVAAKANPLLYRVGLFIYCEKPPTPIPNRFSEDSQMYVWSIAVLPNAEHLIEQTMATANSEQKKAAS